MGDSEQAQESAMIEVLTIIIIVEIRCLSFQYA